VLRERDNRPNLGPGLRRGDNSGDDDIRRNDNLRPAARDIG